MSFSSRAGQDWMDRLILQCLALLTSAVLMMSTAAAGILDRSDVQRRFGAPYQVQEKLRDPPVWPVTSSLEHEAGPVAYVFESIDIAPLPGFEGSPMNFLIAIDRHGQFMAVELLQQHEPVFTFRDLGGLGDTTLREFIAQYAGKRINQPFMIVLDAARNNTGKNSSGGGYALLDGISKATTSVRIVNQTVLTAALEVARARLGFSDHRRQGPPGRVRPDIVGRPDFARMLASGMIGRVHLGNADVDRLFADSEWAEVDEEARLHSDAPYVDLYVAYLNAPTIGRALLGDEQYRTIMEQNPANRHLWWIGSAGRFRIVDDAFIAGAQSPRVAMAQDGGFLDFRDQDFAPVVIDAPPGLNSSRIFGVGSDASIDPARPLDIVLTLTRSRGMMLPTIGSRQVRLSYRPPSELFVHPPPPLPEWVQAWKSRMVDLMVIGLSLLLLSLVLARPRWISMHPRRLRIFRLAFLSYTLGYLGWYAQGQLSIVQITGAFKSLSAGLDLSSYLYDPVSLILIGFTVITLVVWGRGTFCGWLCPFGAMQEFIDILARRLNLPQFRMAPQTAGKLERMRYVILAVLLACAMFAPDLGENLNEVEPFKTSITAAFDRGWPFVAYALSLLLAGACYFKFFCRFICPLGAVLSIGGRLRRLDWLARRAECGQPCQRCKAACRYQAIEANGAIRYDACFQCLDCVGIYHDEKRCVPVVLFRKKGKRLMPSGAGAAT